MWKGRFDSIVGSLDVVCGKSGVTSVRVAGPGTPAPDERLPDELGEHIARALAGEEVDVEVDLSGLTEFQQAVLHKTREIPRGEVRTYQWLAREVGRPAAVRAVGSALARNPVPVLVPCHRVVRRDSRIGAYGCGGPDAKRAALAAEGVDMASLH